MKYLHGVLFGILLTLPLAVWSGTNSLTSVSGGKVQTTHVNQFYTALNQDLVPRNSSGAPTDIGGDLGTSTYRWDDLFAKKFNLGETASALLADENSGAWRFKVSASSVFEIGAASILAKQPIYTGATTDGAISDSTSARTVNVKTGSGGAAHPIVTSADPSTHGLYIVRGSVNSSGTTTAGEGFNSSHPGTGSFGISFNLTFADTPIVVCSTKQAVQLICTAQSTSSTGTTIGIYTVAATLADGAFDFIAIGQRGE